MISSGDDDTAAGTPVERAETTPATLGADGDAPGRHSRSTTAPTVAVAPGRVNPVDGYTNYNDGLYLPMAVGRHAAVAARPRSDNLLRVRAADLDETAELTPDDDPKGWAAYVVAVAHILHEEDPVGGADLAIASDMSTGMGFLLSAALELAIDHALLTVSGRGLPVTDSALTRWRAEREGAGVECGILDQFSATLRETGSALSLDCRGRETGPVPLGDGIGVPVIDTSVSHEPTESGYNDRVHECAAAPGTLRKDADRGLGSLHDVDRDFLDTRTDTLDPVHFRRVRHVVTENERIRRAYDALAMGDLNRVGGVMLAVHDSLRNDYGVSCSESDVAVELTAGTPGVYGARITGGSLGGSAVALVDDDALDRTEHAIRDAVSERVGPDADVFAYRSSTSVRLVGEE